MKNILFTLSLLVSFSSFGQPPNFIGNEEKLKSYFDSKEQPDEIEGVYTVLNGISFDDMEYYITIAIFKQYSRYNAYVVNSNYHTTGFNLYSFLEVSRLQSFPVRHTFIKGEYTINNEYDASYSYSIHGADGQRSIKWIVTDRRGHTSNFELLKIYPKIGENKKTKTKSGEWDGNGSGIIISKSGYIVTNHHVIEDADDIEVEFIINDEVQKFNAEIVQSDKVNDLAIIKIFDMNFDGLDNLPYNFKTRSSDVGTKVYAYGYPMALSLMGKEVKITDGIISSKSGFDGDITTYQITAPIQGGNSGGPLFDDKGNFLGINSSGLSKEIADNVGYTIKSSYVLNLIDVLPKSIDLPSSTKLQPLPLTEQIKEISKYVVLVKVK